MMQGPASADRLRELLERNLQEVFREGDAARRRASLDDLWAEDGVLHVAPRSFVGCDAVDKFAGDLRATHPDYVFAALGPPHLLPDAGLVAWGSGPPGEPSVCIGWDMITVRKRLASRRARSTVAGRTKISVCRDIEGDLSPQLRMAGGTPDLRTATGDFP